MKPRVAVIGCGNIGSFWDETNKSNQAILTHAGAWNHLGLLSALSDSDPERLCAASRHWGVKACYSDYRELLANERLDLVSIATPTTLRLPLIKAILAAGIRAVLLEKPVAATFQDAQAIVAMIRTSGAIVAVNYSRRYDPTLRQVATLVSTGQLGTIQHVVGRYGKGIVENGSHLIDLIQWWLGPTQSCSVLRRVDDDRLDHDPTLDAELKVGLPQTMIPVYLLGVDHRHYSLFELDIVGSAGRISLTERGGRIQHWEVISDSIFPSYRVLHAAEELHIDLTRLVSRAVENLLAVWGGKHSAPYCTLEDAFAALKTALALRDEDDNLY